MGAGYSGELVMDGLKNMDCGVVQAVERVGDAACSSVEEIYKGRLNIEAQQILLTSNIVNLIQDVVIVVAARTNTFHPLRNGRIVLILCGTAGGKPYTVTARMPASDSAVLYGGWPWNYKVHLRPFQCTINQGEGVGVAHFWYRGADTPKLFSNVEHGKHKFLVATFTTKLFNRQHCLLYQALLKRPES
uniref:Uncharacterized protein n=1 Tax=Timema monikensis TaxID=170555 RepID=A0A7R9HU58_9NEOP|nr:unnamed protein product [Timema monikensis]